MPPADAGAPQSPLVETRPGLRSAPLPVPRPAELRRPRSAGRRDSAPVVAAAAPPEDTRSFFDKLFDVQPTARPPLAYAALETNPVNTPPSARLSPAPFLPWGSGAGTAVYDITARVVVLPNGERLEAHSGLGENLDDARSVHLRMRGPTPPGTYDLTEREQPFHGVRALRLTPVGSASTVYNRAGLLAHTYMLGPTGASNGCVSFKDYERFLQAYLRGEVRRLTVVAGSGGDAPPAAQMSASAR